MNKKNYETSQRNESTSFDCEHTMYLESIILSNLPDKFVLILKRNKGLMEQLNLIEFFFHDYFSFCPFRTRCNALLSAFYGYEGSTTKLVIVDQ